MSNQVIASMRWVGVWVLVCSQLSLFTFTVAAQEPTTEPTSLPTSTPATPWTPTPTSRAATSTLVPGGPTATPSGRLVEFSVDDNVIAEGDCASFSWVVKGADSDDNFVVKFDNLRDDRPASLVPAEKYDHRECPVEDTNYELIVTWADGSDPTRRRIKVEVNPVSAGNGGVSGTATPGTPAAFVAVSPIPVIGTPIPLPGGVVVTPVGGGLGSVSVLPETGYRSPPARNSHQLEENIPPGRPWTTLAGGLGIFLGIIGLALGAKTLRKSEVPYED